MVLPARWIPFLTSLAAGLLSATPAEAGSCPVPGGTAISGRVTAEAGGDGLADVTIVLERVIDGFLTEVGRTTTGASGHYQIAGLFPGDYYVRTADAPLLVDEIWPGVACDQACEPLETGATVTAAAGVPVDAIDFALAPGGRIEGTVRLADGVTPVAGATVELWALGSVGIFGQPPATTASDGTFALDGLASGSYKLRAFASGLVAEVHPAAACPSPCGVGSSGAPVVVVAPTATAGIDFALEAGATISGTVTDLAATPLAGVAVFVTNAAGSHFVWSVTGPAGAWQTAEGLIPGTYFARTSSSNVDELWNDRPCDPSCVPSSGDPIVVTTGPTSGIDFALARRGAISGTVRESGTDLPLAGVSLVARGELGQFGFGITGADGSFRIGDLDAGLYLLAAGDGVHVGEIYDDAGSCYDLFSCFPTLPSTPVEVVGTGETTAIDFVLDVGGVVAGTVVAAATGTGVGFATVDLVRDDGTFERTLYVSPDGRFSAAGTPAGVSFRARALPPFPSDLDGEVWQEQPCDPVDCPVDAGATFTIGTAIPACLAFTLDGAPQGTGVAGTVTGSGNPLVGLAVDVFDAAGVAVGTVTTDSSGDFRTTGALALSAGTYFVVAHGSSGFRTELYDDLACVGCDPTTGTPVVVVDGVTTEGVDFALDPDGDPPPPPRETIFLESCRPDDCVYFRGFEDSRLNRSSLLGPGVATISAFTPSQAVWDELVACVRRAYAPFAVDVVDVDPGTAPHLEHVIAGTPGQIGHSADTAGVSPFACGLIPNSTSFTFAGIYGSDPTPEARAELCWTAVHEIGHQHGLDHHFAAPDAMTYLPGCGAKRLMDRTMPCGDNSIEPCLCGGTQENSYAVVRAIVGAEPLLFEDGFEVVEPGENCAWSTEVPPPVPFAPESVSPALACGTLRDAVRPPWPAAVAPPGSPR